MPKETPLLYVEYYDHGSAVGWKADGEIDLATSMEGNICCAVGWCVAEDKRFLCLASFRDTFGDASSSNSHVRQHIIKACIIKRRKLKIPK
jgi:hypothetical protein